MVLFSRITIPMYVDLLKGHMQQVKILRLMCIPIVSILKIRQRIRVLLTIRMLLEGSLHADFLEKLMDNSSLILTAKILFD
jgi:hypothetical protein